MIKILALCSALSLASSSAASPAIHSRPTESSQKGKPTVNGINVGLRVASDRLSATFEDNPSSRQLIGLFPLTVQMKDLHQNEKYFDLPRALPTRASKPKEIKAGDIMLYGSNTLVVFYESFLTSYSYTKLGEVDDPSKLKEILGRGNVEVTFEAE